MADVLFEGKFNLGQALSQFEDFASAVERRLATLKTTVTTTAAGKGGPFSVEETKEQEVQQQKQAKQAEKAAKARAQTAAKEAEDALKAQIAQEKRRAKVAGDSAEEQLKIEQDLAKRKAKAAGDAAEAQLKTDQQMMKARAKAAGDAAEEAIKQQEKVEKGFLNIILKSYALHQVGQLLNQTITQPLANFAKGILDITVRFDTLERLLSQRGGKSLEQIGKSMDSVGKVALARNFDLETSITLYSRLFEATRGAIDDKLFETIGLGLSNVMSTIEPSERRSFFGQLQDVIGGGNVANLDRTLSLAPALKAEYDHVKRAAAGVVTEQQAMIQALEVLAKQPALNDLETNLKNVHVRMQMIQIQIGKVYKDELLQLTNYLEKKVFPVIHNIVTRFEQLPEAIQNTIAVMTGLVALLAPLIGTLGTFELLFPDFLASTVTAARLGSMLARIGSLLNPITAALTAIAAIVTYLITNNIGGAGDAFDTLINTLKDTLLTTLQDIYTIVTSLYGIVEGFLLLLAKIPGLTYGLGIIVNYLINILNVVMTVNQPLRYLAMTLQLISDFLHGDFELGFDRFRLAQMKMAKSIYDSMPFLYKFTDWMIGLFAEGQESSMNKMNEEIEKLEKNIKKLDTAAAEADGMKQQEKQALALAEAYSLAAAQAGNLNKKINEQEEALKNQQFDISISDSQAYLDSQLRIRAYDRQQEMRQIGDLDYTTAAGRAEAEQRAQQVQQGALTDAERARQARVAQAVAKALQEKRKEFVKELTKEIQKNEVQLDPDIRKVYEHQVQYIDMLLRQVDKLSTDKMPGEAEAVFNQGITEARGLKYGPNAQLVAKRIALDATEVVRVAYGEALKTPEYDQAVQAGKEAARKIRDDIQKGIEQEQQVQIDKWFIEEGDKLDKQTAAAKEATKKAIEHARVIADYGDAEHQISESEKELLRLEGLRLQLEKDFIEKSKDVGFKQANIDSQLNKADKASEKRNDQIRADASAARLQIQKRFIKTEEENLKTADELQKLLLRNVNDRIETLKLLIGLTGDEGKYADQLRQAVDEKNATLQKTIGGMVKSSAGELYGALGTFRRGELGDKIQGEDAQTLNLFMAAANALSQSSIATLSRFEIDKMLENSQKMVAVMRTMITGVIGDDDASIRQRLSAQNILNETEDFIKALKDAQKLTEGLSVYNLEIKEARLESLEKQKDVNEQVQKELDITREIMSLRRQRGVGQSVLDILSGGRIDDYSMEKQILERKMEAAKLELEMAVLRLEIELEIHLMKMREKNATEEEMQAVREKYTDLISNMKKEGKLRQDLLKEQIDSLSYLSGSIGDMVFQGLAIGLKKIFGMGDDKKVTVQGDVDWNDQEFPGAGIPDYGDTPKKKGGLGDIFNPKEIDKTGQSIDVLDGKYKKIGATAGVVAKAIMAMNDLSMKSIRNAIAAALDAFASEALVQAIRFAAIALSALVFGDYGTAAKAGIAAAAWGGVAVAAKVGAALIGVGDGDSAANSQSSQSSAAGTTPAATEAAILKQQALSITILLDIRTDEGITIKKHIKALNQNTELTNLTMNQQEGWAFAPTP